ncbi:VIER F-box protein 2 [Tanacetum coccineum]
MKEQDLYTVSREGQYAVSKIRHFKTLSLDELRSPDSNLFSDQEYSKEEEEAMVETMKQYMSETRADYGSGVTRPKIKEKDRFELKGQFLKELRTNTFSGSDHEDANEHIEKVLEIMNLFHIPNITIDQVMLRAFPMSLTRATSRWLRNKPTSLITTLEDLKTKFLRKYCPPARTSKKMEEIKNFQQEPDENLYQAWERFKDLLMKCPLHYLMEMQEAVLFYNGLDVPTRQILDSRDDIPSKTTTDVKTAIQEMAKYSQKWHNGTSKVRSTKTSDGFSAIQAQLNNLGRKIKKFKRNNGACLEARLMGETLVINRSLDPLNGDYIELNNLNEPFELRRNQGDDLIPTIEECEVIEEFRTRDEDLDTKIDDYPILEDMSAYRDEGMGDIIVGKPFLREIGIKARRFKGMITIYNGNDEVTYQMVRSHPRFKHQTNEQCNKIQPLLKDPIISEMRRWKKGSHAGTLACMRWNGEKKLKTIIMEYLVKLRKRRAFWSLNEDILKINNSDNQYAVNLDNSTNNVLIPLDSWTSGLLVYKLTLSIRMTKVIKGEFEKLEDLMVEDVSLTYDTSLEVFNNEFNRSRRMDDDLFTYEVEVANISCDSNMDDDSEHEADDDMGYDPSDVAFTEWGNDEVELTDEESSDNEDDVVEVFRIDTNIFDYETPICLAFNEFNYLLKVDPDLLTKDIMGFKTYEDYKDDLIYEWNENVPWVYDKSWLDNGIWKEPTPEICPVLTLLETRSITKTEWYEALEDCELKEEALRNKANMEGLIEEDDDDESRYEQRRRWNVYTNYDDAYEINQDVAEREELCEIHELPVCNIRRFEMINYSFGQDEEYVAIKEDEYEDLARTSEDACRAYQEIFRMMDEGWMVTRAE